MEMASTQGGWAVARQPGCLPAGIASASPAVVGVSAFAFQGTNAHAVMAAAGVVAGASAAKPSADWARQRFWLAPRPHAGASSWLSAGCLALPLLLLRPCSQPSPLQLPPFAALWRAAPAPGSRQAILQSAPLASPVLAYLWDHQVSGKPLFPGAAFFELAAAAVKTILTVDASPALMGATIPAPLVLPPVQPAQGGQPDVAAVSCKLDAVAGTVELVSGQRSTHLRAALSAVRALPSSGSAAAAAAAGRGSQAALHSTVGASLRHLTAEAAYVGSIDNAAQRAADVFLSPAVLDCCLHLGALPAAAAGQLKVPAGIQALLLPGTAAAAHGPGSSASYAAAALQVQSSRDASLIDYSLLAPSGCSACAISGLQAKPLGAQPKAAPATGTEAPAGHMLYTVSWAVQQPAAQPLPAMPGGGATAAIEVGADAATLCSTGIAAFQVAAAEHQGGLELLTTSAQPQLTITPATGSAGQGASLLWGMLRSVALEQTSATTTATDADSLAAGRRSGAARGAALLCIAAAAAVGAAGSSDAYGRAARGGLGFAATLLPCATAPAAALGGSAGQLQAIKAAHGRVAVTGGMGSLGSVLACWAEDARIASELVLLGRSGRLAGADAAPSLLALLARSATAVVLAMADVAGSEGSLAAFGGAAAARGAPLSALFHSGGVLADATLAKQAPSGIRAVFAAKVSAAMRWRGILQSQPAAAEVLFSSVAALLGSGGQANYSAANAALDGMATGLQQQVHRTVLQVCFFQCCATCGQWPLRCCSPAACFHCCRAPRQPACSGAPGRAAAWQPKTAPPRCACSAWAWR